MNQEVIGKLEKFFRQFTFVYLEKEVTLLSPTDKPQGIYFLINGFVRQFTTSVDGQELTIHIFEPGSFFPIEWAINDYQSPYYFETLTVASLYLAPKKSVINFLDKNPEIYRDLVSRLLWGISGMSRRIESFAFGSAYSRVISTLIYLAKHFGKKDRTKITIPHFTHDTIAHLTGITRERTSLQMEKLEKLKLIKYEHNGAVVLSKLQLLEKELLEN